MKFFLILCFFIIIIGILSVVYIFPYLQKTKTKSNTTIKNKTKLDNQLNKSSKELQKAITRSKNVTEVIQELKKKININQFNNNVKQGINISQKRGLDPRVNIHVNLNDPEERDSLGL